MLASFTVAIAFIALARSQGIVDMKCVEMNCKMEFTACTQDPMCLKAVGCVGDCVKLDDINAIQNCTSNCAFTYGTSSLLNALSCFNKYKCLNLPEIPSTCKGPDNVKIMKNITLAEISGVKLYVLRGYNPVYDCYPCQTQMVSGDTFTSNFMAYDVNPEEPPLKPYTETGIAKDLAPMPGFNVTIQFGLPLISTIWVFDQVGDYFLAYYCGYGNMWNYEGGFVYSTKTMIDESAIAGIRESFMRGVGLDFDKMCSPYKEMCNKL